MHTCLSSNAAWMPRFLCFLTIYCQYCYSKLLNILITKLYVLGALPVGNALRYWQDDNSIITNSSLHVGTSIEYYKINLLFPNGTRDREGNRGVKEAY